MTNAEAPRILIKTTTSGWYEQYNPVDDDVFEKRTRKLPEDTIMEDLSAARAYYREYLTGIGVPTTPTPAATPAATPAQAGLQAAAASNGQAEVPTTLADTGRVLVGKTITITCSEKGCKATRVIKPQDQFQVKRCVEHQTEHRKALRRQKQREKTAARRAEREAAKAAAAA